MSEMTIIIIVIFAILAAFSTYGIVRVRSKVRGLSQAMFGTDSLIDGINRQADVLAETPKSVTGMTSLMEPQIRRDFPDFNWQEFKDKAENMLKSAFLAISAQDIRRLTKDASEDVREQIRNHIETNLQEQITEKYTNIQIHQTEIANYRHEGGKCVITIQSAVGYSFVKEQGGKVIEGSKERKTQSRFNIELVYIQDASKFMFDNAQGTICPNCGAPVRNLGNFRCEFCGSGVTPINVKVWSLHKLYEVDYNHI